MPLIFLRVGQLHEREVLQVHVEQVPRPGAFGGEDQAVVVRHEALAREVQAAVVGWVGGELEHLEPGLLRLENLVLVRVDLALERGGICRDGVQAEAKAQGEQPLRMSWMSVAAVEWACSLPLVLAMMTSLPLAGSGGNQMLPWSERPWATGSGSGDRPGERDGGDVAVRKRRPCWMFKTWNREVFLGKTRGRFHRAGRWRPMGGGLLRRELLMRG